MAGLPLYNGAAVGAQTRYSASRTGVAVGAGTRAYRLGQGRPAVAPPAAPSGATPPAGAVPAGGPGASGAPTWTPPPTGSYNPVRDTEVEEGERGLGQLEGDTATKRTRGTADYFTSLGEINRQRGQESQDYGTQQEALKRAFSQLAGKQESQADKYGVLGGGAGLASAAARSANQSREQQAQAQAHSRRTEQFDLNQGKLARELAPPDASNPLGGRYFQDLGTGLTNAQANQAFFAESQHRLAGQEAGERGWTPPPSVTPAGAPSGLASRVTRSPAGTVATGTATRAWRTRRR